MITVGYVLGSLCECTQCPSDKIDRIQITHMYSKIGHSFWVEAETTNTQSIMINN